MAIYSVYVSSRDDAEAHHWLTFFRRHGYKGLKGLVMERVYWLEGNLQPDRLLPLLANSVYQSTSSQSRLDPSQGPILEIAYRQAVTDPETPSILEAAHALGEGGLNLCGSAGATSFAESPGRMRSGWQNAFFLIRWSNGFANPMSL